MRQKLFNTQKNLRKSTRCVCTSALFIQKIWCQTMKFHSPLPLEPARCGPEWDCSNNKCCREKDLQVSFLFQRISIKYVQSSGQPAKRRLRTKTQSIVLMHRVASSGIKERVQNIMSVYEHKTDLYFFRGYLVCNELS